MARLMLYVSIAKTLTISNLLFVPAVETSSPCKKEKKKLGVITIPVSLNVHKLRLKSVLLQA